MYVCTYNIINMCNVCTIIHIKAVLYVVLILRLTVCTQGFFQRRASIYLSPYIDIEYEIDMYVRTYVCMCVANA